MQGARTAPREEGAAVSRQQAAGALLRPAGGRPELPALAPDSPLPDYLRFALLNHPQWRLPMTTGARAVLAIAPARALPDPKLTFQADITRAR